MAAKGTVEGRQVSLPERDWERFHNHPCERCATTCTDCQSCGYPHCWNDCFGPEHEEWG